MANQDEFNKMQELVDLADQKALSQVKEDYLNIKAPVNLSARLVSHIQASEVRKPPFWKISWMPVGLGSVATLLIVVLLIRPVSNPSTEGVFSLTSLPSLSDTSLYLPSSPTYSIPSSNEMTGISLLPQTPRYGNSEEKIKKYPRKNETKR